MKFWRPNLGLYFAAATVPLISWDHYGLAWIRARLWVTLAGVCCGAVGGRPIGGTIISGRTYSSVDRRNPGRIHLSAENNHQFAGRLSDCSI